MLINNNNTSDIYILIQRDAIGYVFKKDVIDNLQGTGDLDAKIPNDKIKLLFNNEKTLNVSNNIINISEIINDIFICISKSIWNNKSIKEDLKICLYNIADNL